MTKVYKFQLCIKLYSTWIRTILCLMKIRSRSLFILILLSHLIYNVVPFDISSWLISFGWNAISNRPKHNKECSERNHNEYERNGVGK